LVFDRPQVFAVELFNQSFHEALSSEILPRFPRGFLRWVTLPKYQVFHALPIGAAFGNTLDNREPLSLDLVGRRRFLTSPGDPRLL
jgi:hypothetical protein